MRRNIVTWDPSEGRQNVELYVDEIAPPGTEIISYAQYDTFISHKGDDTTLAETIGKALHLQGLKGYLDRWDPTVKGDSLELEEYIRKVIRETPSILAVVTENTPLSWWVPFELGVARETKSQIATFLQVDENSRDEVTLPSYLRAWPILATGPELVVWARALARSRVIPFLGQSDYLEKSFQEGGRTIDRLEASGKVRFF